MHDSRLRNLLLDLGRFCMALGTAAVVCIPGALVVGALWTLEQDMEQYASTASDNADVAMLHAVVDGRASFDGYVSLVTPEEQSLLKPVQLSDAEAAVTADQTVAQRQSDIAADHMESVRWLVGGMGVIALITLRFGIAWFKHVYAVRSDVAPQTQVQPSRT